MATRKPLLQKNTVTLSKCQEKVPRLIKIISGTRERRKKRGNGANISQYQ